MHGGFYLLLAASAARYVSRHGLGDGGLLVLVLALALAAGYGAVLIWPLPRRSWLAGMLAGWLLLVVIAPSFALCAVPLLFAALGELPARAAVAVAAGLTTVVIAAQLQLAERFDLSLVLAPVAVAVIATAAYLQLARTSEQLAASQRQAGVLEERQRLARDIHDTIAQGLSSVNLLLQAADRDWETRPEAAREHVRQAAGTARENLAEARQVVAGLTPIALTGQSLAGALGDLCSGAGARFVIEGEPYPLGGDLDVALLRITQSALANVTEHAAATQAAVTLTYLPGSVTLDVCDDGRGFVPGTAAGEPGRGYGLAAIRQRAELLHGTVTVESAPGEGTALAVTLPTGGTG